jgi:hypothetical protein
MHERVKYMHTGVEGVKGKVLVAQPTFDLLWVADTAPRILGVFLFECMKHLYLCSRNHTSFCDIFIYILTSWVISQTLIFVFKVFCYCPIWPYQAGGARTTDPNNRSIYLFIYIWRSKTCVYMAPLFMFKKSQVFMWFICTTFIYLFICLYLTI